MSLPDYNCRLCGGPHALRYCKQFLKASVEERTDFVHENKMCYFCLAMSHSWEHCHSKNRCRKCNSCHHTLLHKDSKQQQRQQRKAPQHRQQQQHRKQPKSLPERQKHKLRRQLDVIRGPSISKPPAELNLISSYSGGSVLNPGRSRCKQPTSLPERQKHKLRRQLDVIRGPSISKPPAELNLTSSSSGGSVLNPGRSRLLQSYISKRAKELIKQMEETIQLL